MPIDRRMREALVPLLLVAFALLCYATIVPAYFISDDFALIGRVATKGMFSVWRGAGGAFLRPGTVLSYVIDHRLWGLNPVGYHLTNILFHGIAAYGVFRIARHYLKKTPDDEPTLLPLCAGALFVALSSHSESVSWISGRTDVIATALGLAATVCFLQVIERRSFGRGLVALLLLAAALLTKESVVVFPPIWGLLFAHEWWSKKEAPSRHSAVFLGLSWVVLGGYFLLRKVALGSFIGGYGAEVHLSFAQISFAQNLFQSLLRTFLPAIPVRLYAAVLLSAGLGVAALGAGVVLRGKSVAAREWPIASLVAACYFVSLIAVIAMPVRLFETTTERHLYLPSAFACVLAAWVVAALLPRARAHTAALVAVVLIQAFALHLINDRWVTAARICKQVGSEIARHEPEGHLLLNVPMSYRGVPIFANGLSQAVHIFEGSSRGGPRRVLCKHTVDSGAQAFEAQLAGEVLTLALSGGARCVELSELGLGVQNRGQVLTVRLPARGDEPRPPFTEAISFRSAATTPMLRTIPLSVAP